MYKSLTLPMFAAALMFTGTASLADGHGGYSSSDYVVEVPSGLCPSTQQEMALCAYGKREYTVLAAPTSDGFCEGGQAVTAGMAVSDNRNEARRAALKTCSANRGSLGPCVVIATVRRR